MRQRLNAAKLDHPADSSAPGKRIGLARALSKLGFCSRTDAGDLIRAGRVKLNGVIRRDPESPVRLERDRIEVDDRAVETAAKIYVMLNKPRDFVTTASDEKGRSTVYDLLDQKHSWLAPVGRLDKASEGLLLLTNDSEWAARVTAPESHLPKTYHVQIAAVANEALLDSLRRGVRDAGEDLRVTAASILRQGGRNSWLEVTLQEGRNRHIRRMLNALGIEVLRLVRVAIGPLPLGDLAKSASRPLTPEEKAAIDAALPQDRPSSARKRTPGLQTIGGTSTL
jgi:23S rRNA pseudouridine2605 synthase